jgi:curved DNA-binding protein CbpA
MQGYNNKSYYSVLGIPNFSSLEDIKKAFKSLALQTHPDK